MAILSIVLLVFFVIAAILLILLVLVQNEEGDSLGGIFAGGSGSAFGSRSGNVLTRATTVLGALFLVLSLGLALLNRTPGGSGVEAAGRRQSSGSVESNWVDEELEARNRPVEQVSTEPVLETEPTVEAELVPEIEPPVEPEPARETVSALGLQPAVGTAPVREPEPVVEPEPILDAETALETEPVLDGEEAVSQ